MTDQIEFPELAVRALLIQKGMSLRNVRLILTDLPNIEATHWAWDSVARVHRQVKGEIGGGWIASATVLGVTSADLHKFDSRIAFHNLEERPEAPVQRFLKDKGMSGRDVLFTAPGGTQSVWAWNAKRNVHRMEQGLDTEGRKLAEVVMTTQEMSLYD